MLWPTSYLWCLVESRAKQVASDLFFCPSPLLQCLHYTVAWHLWFPSWSYSIWVFRIQGRSPRIELSLFYLIIPLWWRWQPKVPPGLAELPKRILPWGDFFFSSEADGYQDQPGKLGLTHAPSVNFSGSREAAILFSSLRTIRRETEVLLVSSGTA